MRFEYSGDVNEIEHGGMWIGSDDGNEFEVLRVCSWAAHIGEDEARTSFGSPSAVLVDIGAVYLDLTSDSYKQSARDYCGLTDDCGPVELAYALAEYGHADWETRTFVVSELAAEFIAGWLVQREAPKRARQLLRDYAIGASNYRRVHALENAFPYLSRTETRVLDRAMQRTHSEDRDGTDPLELADRLLDAHGIEKIHGADHVYYHGDHTAYYVNTGDTYNPTITWDVETGIYRLECYGDLVQRLENQNRILK